MIRRGVRMAGMAAFGLFAVSGAQAEPLPERALNGVLQSSSWKALLLAPEAKASGLLDGCITLVVPSRLRADLDFFDGESIEVSGEYSENMGSPDPAVFDQRYEGWPLQDWCAGRFLFVTAMKKAADKP